MSGLVIPSVLEDGEWKVDLTQTMFSMLGGAMGQMMEDMGQAMQQGMEEMAEQMADSMEQSFEEFAAEAERQNQQPQSDGN